ncbi:MAG: aminotransferase class IV [Vicinamibacterales bacterium]
MPTFVNINGTLFDKQHAAISVFDHGFLYGEGIYETLRTYHGQPFLFERHMRRLRQSASMMSLTVPISDGAIAARALETMKAAGLGGPAGSEAYLRILVTRGVGDISYDPASCPEPSIVMIAKEQIDPPADAYRKGVKVVLVSVVRNHPGTVNPLIKSNNLLNNALGMQEAMRAHAFEGVMRNYRGELAECTTANIFVVRDGAALTPPLDAGLLAGITREFLFEVGDEIGVPVREQTLRDEDLFGADEAFLTSTTREIVPIVTVDDRTIGAGTPGTVTRKLLDAFRRRAGVQKRLAGARPA